jgi:uncharacterized protein
MIQTQTQTPSRTLLVAFSPVLIVALGVLTARLSLPQLGAWAWAVTMPVYWTSMAAVFILSGGTSKLASLFRLSRGSRFLPVVALVVGLAPFPMLMLPNIAYLKPALLVVLWIAFALVNGVLEEVYWRGFLLTELRSWPMWLAVGYSSVLFIAIHFLMLGALAPELFNLPFLFILAVLTAALVGMFLYSGSLRWPVVAHILADVGNMNIFVFMGLLPLVF